MNNTLELAIDISHFLSKFPGWWLTIGFEENGGRASCAPYGKGQPYGLQHHADSTDPMETGFHATADTTHAALRDVMRQAQEYLEKQDG
jgi:hypothetical protein